VQTPNTFRHFNSSVRANIPCATPVVSKSHGSQNCVLSSLLVGSRMVVAIFALRVCPEAASPPRRRAWAEDTAASFFESIPVVCSNQSVTELRAGLWSSPSRHSIARLARLKIMESLPQSPLTGSSQNYPLQRRKFASSQGVLTLVAISPSPPSSAPRRRQISFCEWRQRRPRHSSILGWISIMRPVFVRPPRIEPSTRAILSHPEQRVDVRGRSSSPW